MPPPPSVTDPVLVVRPLEDAWRPALDAVLARLGAPRLDDVARLAPKLAELSRAYNAGETKRDLPLEARVAFSFARDVPKGAAAVRELVAAGLLALEEARPLRVLDVGAGLGAMTWGVVRALEAAGQRGRIEAVFADADARALAAAEWIAAAAPRGPVELAVTTRPLRLGAGPLRLGEADLVIAGQVLSELDLELDPDARVERHAALLSGLLEGAVAPAGALVVVEPALRDRTRHLHAVRDRLVSAGATVFAPCLHAGPCPALAGEGDWCHEDLAVDLPAWLVPLARGAGLRFQGLTFSHLVLRRDGATLAARTKAGGLRLRVVSDVLRTKGKAELFACTEHGARVRLRRLDRDERSAPSDWDELRRGDVVTLTGDVGDSGRLPPNVTIDVWPRGH